MLNTQKLNEIVGTIAKEAKNILGDSLERVILYGSYARRDSNNESDVDVLLLTNLPACNLRLYRTKINRLASRLSLNYDTLVSVTLKDTETFYRYQNDIPFYSNVMREGVEYRA